MRFTSVPAFLRALSCALGLALTVALATIAAPNALASPLGPGTCARVYVLVIPGTWEINSGNTVSGLLGPTVSGLPADIAVRQISYDATAFPWEKDGKGAIYGKSKATAITNTTAAAKLINDTCPAANIALVGYSQGADAAGDVAASIGTGAGVVRPEKIASVVLIADPRRASTDPLVGPALRGQGSGGPRRSGFGWLTDRVHQICAPDDMYCNLDQSYYLSRIIGFLAETSDPNPAQIVQYYGEAMAIVGNLLFSGGPGALADELTDEKARAQIVAYFQFLQSGAHGDYNQFEVAPGVTALEWTHDHLASL